MSIFDFPRIHFRGSQFANPGTANNNSLGPGAELTITSDTERVQPFAADMTDAEFHAWITGADSSGLVRGQWNYYGDMGFRFLDVSVTSIQRKSGVPIVDVAADSLIGAKVYLTNALLCDANPEGFDTTQIFSEALEIVAPQALGGTGTFRSRQPSRATTRSLNWYRNVSFHGVLGNRTSGGAGGASATFQSSIIVEKDDLREIPDRGVEYDQVLHRLLPRAGPSESSAVADLIERLRTPQARGIVVRYNLYLTYPRIADPDLIVDFAAGKRTENPAIGFVLGTIAPWYRGEPESATMGRFLKSSEPYVNPYRTDAKPYYLAPIVARANETTVSLDTINCFPEDGPLGAKWNLGEVTLGVRLATAPGTNPALNTNAVRKIGTIPNDQDHYETQGGIYDVYVAPELRAAIEDPDCELVISASQPTQSVLLYEPEYMLAADSGCNYMEEHPKTVAKRVATIEGHKGLHTALRAEVPLFLLRRGKIPAGETTIAVEQWKFTPSGDPFNFGAYRYPTLLKESDLIATNGSAAHEPAPLDGSGVRMFRYVPPGLYPRPITGQAFASFAFQEYFCVVRVLPYDDYSNVSHEQLTFDFIYQNVLRYYNLILPAMSTRLDTSDSTIWASPGAARYLMRTTDPAVWDTHVYMPRTRDLSEPRRRLLWRYCEKVLRDNGITISDSDRKTIDARRA